MQTEQLEALARDFAKRASAMEWLTDALLISGSSPSSDPRSQPGMRTIENHVVLIGPTTEEPPTLETLLSEPIGRSTRLEQDWLRVRPESSGLLNMEKYIAVVTTTPARDKELNLLVVHYRRGDDGESVRFTLDHVEELDRPGTNKQLADDDWVRDNLSTWLDEENRSAEDPAGSPGHLHLDSPHNRESPVRTDPTNLGEVGSYTSGRLAFAFAKSVPDHVLAAFSALAVDAPRAAPPLPEPVVEVWNAWSPDRRDAGWREDEGDPFPDEPWRHDWASQLDGVLRWTGVGWELLCSFSWKTHPVTASEALAWLAPFVATDHRPRRQLVGHAQYEYDPAPHLFWVVAGRWSREDINPEGYIGP